MACESCRSHTRQLLRSALRAGAASRSAAAATSSSSFFFPRANAVTTLPQLRHFSNTNSRQLLENLGGKGLAAPYLVVGSTERLYKVCGDAADYYITEEVRKKEEVQKMEDGEEVGKSRDPKNVWHKTFGLAPTFSTWSHVTMLHLYLLNARVRCFEREVYRRWQHQLVDHFFFEAEKKMHVDHNITSSALRQRYLRDIFIQWRGLLLAYDEGVIKGDAILASAVWRNLFKGDPDVDPRALAAVVGWMRSRLREFEITSDYTFPTRATEILRDPVIKYWNQLEKTFKPKTLREDGEVDIADLMEEETVEQAQQAAAAGEASVKS